jgi:hypothetical protein
VMHVFAGCQAVMIYGVFRRLLIEVVRRCGQAGSLRARLYGIRQRGFSRLIFLYFRF